MSCKIENEIAKYRAFKRPLAICKLGTSISYVLFVVNAMSMLRFNKVVSFGKISNNLKFSWKHLAFVTIRQIARIVVARKFRSRR